MSTPSFEISANSKTPVKQPIEQAKEAVNESEYRQLSLFLRDQPGFSLAIALYNAPAVRNAVIERATRELAAQAVTVTRLDLIDTPGEQMLLERLRTHCEAVSLPEGHRHAVMVTGIEAALDYSSFPIPSTQDANTGLALLQNANVQRDHFPQVIDAPVLLWLSPMAESAFAQAAPDLWHWRQAFFDFSIPLERQRDLEERELALPIPESTSLDAKEKRGRIAVLKDALARERTSAAAESPASKRRQMRLLNEIGAAHYCLGELEAATSCFEQCWVIAQELDDPGYAASAYGNLGNVMFQRGDLGQAEQMYRKALAIQESLGQRLNMATAYASLGNIMFTRGDLDTAEQMHQKALEIEEHLGRREGMACAYANLANIMFTRGDLDTAEQMHQNALVIEEHLGRREGMASAYANLGNIMFQRGDLDTAEQTYRKALEINEQLGQREGIASDYGNLGLVMLQRGDLDGADEMYRKALKINEQLGRRQGKANAYANLGIIMEGRGDLAGAREMLTKARDLFEQVGAQPMVEKVQSWIDQLPS